MGVVHIGHVRMFVPHRFMPMAMGVALSRGIAGLVRVLAPPVMINLIEAAALKACEALLPAGHQSLGTRINVSHIAATPVGMKVTATAEVVSVTGRHIVMKVGAHDERELIGEGTHERVVVNVARFDTRLQEKITMVATRVK